MAVSIGLIAQKVEERAPRSWAEEWDNAGLLVGSYAGKAERVLLALDGTREVVAEAAERGVQLILAHHPLLFKPLKNLRDDNRQARAPLELLRRDIAYYAAHTNLDQSVFSSGLSLARLLGVAQPEVLSPVPETLYKLATFVPAAEAEALRQVLVRAGAGKGLAGGEHGECYEECFFQVRGQGMFRAVDGAEPAVGRVGELTRVEETRLESIVSEKYLERAVRALRQGHPYEEPAYDVIRMETPGKIHGYGAVGELKTAMELGVLWRDFLRGLSGFLDQEYDMAAVRVTGEASRLIKKVAVANGSGGSLLPVALAKGADLFVTGELGYHQVLEAVEEGMAVLEMGHFLSEIPMMAALRAWLAAQKELAGVEWLMSRRHRGVWVGDWDV